MAVALYMDQHVKSAITDGLRFRGVDVLRTQDDGYEQADDEDVLDHAAALGRVVFTQDEDFLVIAQRRQSTGIPFAGVVFAHQDGPSIGDCVRDLEVVGLAGHPADFADRVEYLPL